MEDEKNRIQNLPKEEQKQIADDYMYALKIAREEITNPSYRLYPIITKQNQNLDNNQQQKYKA